MVAHEGGFLVLDGLEELKAHGGDHLPCRLFDQNSSPMDLWESLVLRRLSLGELSAFGMVHLLMSLAERSEVDFEKVLPLTRQLGIKPKWLSAARLKEIRHALPILERFTDLFQLGGKELEALMALSQASLKRVASLLEGRRLKGQKLTSLLLLVGELEKAGKLDWPTFLVEHPHFDQETPLSEIKQALEELRYPRLNQLKQRYQEARRLLPEGVKVELDPFFEADSLHLSMELHSEKELLELCRQLNQACQEGHLQKLFDLL